MMVKGRTVEGEAVAAVGGRKRWRATYPRENLIMLVVTATVAMGIAATVGTLMQAVVEEGLAMVNHRH